MYHETRVYRYFIVVTRRALNMQMKRRTNARQRSSMVLPVDHSTFSVLFRHVASWRFPCSIYIHKYYNEASNVTSDWQTKVFKFAEGHVSKWRFRKLPSNFDIKLLTIIIENRKINLFVYID